jgi:hypothetical protein
LRASTVHTPYCSSDETSSRSWVNSFFPLVDDVANVLRAVDCSPNRSFLRSSTGFTTVCMPYCLTDGSLDRFFICSSTAFPTVCMLYCSAYGTTARLWVHSYLLLVDDFANVPRAVDCSPDRSFFRSSTAFTTVYAPYCSADGSGLLILPLVNGFRDALRAVLLSGRLGGWHYCSVVGSLISSACR